MNKAAAIGFAVGLAFLGGVVFLYGGSGGPTKAQGLAKSGVAGNEESAEADTGSKPAEKKLAPFTPAGSQPLAKPEPKGTGVRMARSVAPGGYRSGQPLEVIVSLDHDGKDKVTALAVVERLPQGWTFQEVSGGAKPVIMPSKGAAGELTFVWVQVPSFPCTVSYRVVPAPEVTGPQELQGQAVYRQLGPEQRTEMLKTVATAATP